MLDGYEEERGSKLREIFRYVHSAFFWSCILACSVATHIFCNTRALFVKDESRKEEIYRKGGKFWGSFMTAASLVKVNISGLENIPADTNVIFTPNHQSYIDIFILLKYLPCSFKFIIMRKLFRVPVVGPHIKRSGFIALDRKDRKNSIDTIHRIIDLLKKNESIVIFPEGVLTKDGSLGDFSRGASVIIQRSRKPVIPIAIDGTFGVLPKGAWKLHPAKVNVRIGKPVHFEKYYDEVNRNTSTSLASELRGIVGGLKNNCNGENV